METVGYLLQFIGGVVVASGAAVALAYWLFKLFTEKWLTAKFAERLESYKHAQQKELENVRFEINKLMDRSVKLHQREYDALPEAWSLMVEAYHLTRTAVSRIQQYPNLDTATQAQIDDFLLGSGLKDWQIEELKTASDRDEYLRNALDWSRIHNAREAARDFHVFRLKQRIFLLPDIHDKFELMDDMIINSIIEREMSLRDGSYSGQKEARDKLLGEGDRVVKELSSDIIGRLWN